MDVMSSFTKRVWIPVVFVGLNVASAQTPTCPTFFTGDDRTNKGVNVTESELINCDVFNNLIDIMEQLNILTPRTSSCYTLQKVHQMFGAKSSNSQTVTISFQFEEKFKNSGDKRATGDHVMCTGNIPYKLQGRQPSSAKKNESESDRNNTIALATSTRGAENSVLSYTQVVVIATCSAVIGTFFILAAALRIRNYVKRLRDEHQSNRRSNNYRLPLSKGQNSHEGLSRKSSSSSKNSQQNSLLDKDGSKYEESTSQSACQPLLDATPRLIVTAPSTVSTPSGSHSSIQFIDEESENRGKTVCENDQNVSLPKDNHAVQSEAVDTVENDETNHLKCNNERSNQQEANGKSNKPETIDMPIKQEANVKSSNQEGNQNSNELDANEDKDEPNVDKEVPKDECTPPLREQSVSAGLSQSDDSLTSHNASYCYGNQVEYSNGGYGNVGYCPSIETEEPLDILDETEEDNHHNNGSRKNSFNRNFCENIPTSFEQDEIKSALCEKVNSERTSDERPSLMDTFNVVSLDQYEQRRKLQRQDRTLTQTNSFDTDNF